MFQAIHGSAFDLAGKNQANPVASIWSTQMLLDHLGETELATLLMHAIEAVLRAGKVRTRDLGGSHSTTNMTDAVCQALAAAAGTGAAAKQTPRKTAASNAITGEETVRYHSLQEHLKTYVLTEDPQHHEAQVDTTSGLTLVQLQSGR